MNLFSKRIVKFAGLVRHRTLLPNTRIPNEYLAKEKIEKLTLCPRSGTVKVSCYYNGMYWVCPNPRDRERAKLHDEYYHQGYYMTARDYFLTEEDFNNKDNWNS